MNDETELKCLDLHIIFTSLFIKNLNPHRDSDIEDELNWIKDSYFEWKKTYSKTLNYNDVKTSMTKFIDGCFI